MTWLRVFFIGGLTSYRALFYWLTPWIYVPSLLVAPIFQILLFVYIGRNAGLESDEFYVIGNALQYAAIPCVFAMGFAISGERFQQTLGRYSVSPARRLPLFLGRAVPVMLNGAFVAAFSLAVGGLLLGIDIPASALAPLALVVLVCAFSCTGLGLITAALGLRVRETAVLANIIFGLLLIFTGANVPLDRAAGLDASDLERDPAHARDRGGAHARRRRLARVRRLPARRRDCSSESSMGWSATA